MGETSTSIQVARKQSFSDLPLSFGIHPNKKDVTSIKDIDAIKASVKNLVLTNFGERPFNFGLGGNVSGLLFENVDVTTAISLENNIRVMLREWEPRIRLNEVSVFDYPDENRLEISIDFTVIGKSELEVVSFYLDRIR